MNHQNNFFNQFKNAAEETEQQPFQGFEEVWQRVEIRLDTSEKKVIPIWKRLSTIAAASLLLILLAGAFWWKPKNDNPNWVQKNEKATPGPLSGSTEVTPIENPDTQKRSDSFTNKDMAALERKQADKTYPQHDELQGLDLVNEEPPYSKKALATLRTRDADEVEQTQIKASTPPLLPVVADTLLAKVSITPKVKGRVLDEKGQPIPGSYVMVKGTNRGVLTDSTGKFDIVAKSGEQLNVTFVGYEPTDLSVVDGRDLAVSLNPSVNALNDVIVTGYTSKQRKSITGATQVITSKEFRQNKLNPQESLQGRVAGVQVSPSAPGSGTEVRIRGNNSVNVQNEPLYVINGVVADKNTIKKINPADIKQIHVLKDASASAIYGSRGANGVVLINTINTTQTDTINQKKLSDELNRLGINLDNTLPQGSDTDLSDEGYNPLVENPFTSPAVSPLSTFSIDVDNAAYTNIRRYINNGQKIPQDMVRIEEMVNFFKYNYPPPTNNDPFAVHTEYFDAPWNDRHKLLRVALQAKDIPAASLPPSNIVFLLDVSGSMDAPNKLPLLKSSLRVLLDELREQDRVSIVVYAGAAGLVLPPTSGAEKETILQALYNLNAGGSTAGGEGIELAYKTAGENFIKNGNNRVVLATDGDFNVGVNSQAGLQRLIEKKRETGIFLTCLGFGMGNYKDNLLELLADKGNGNYAYIDNQQEANRFLGKEFKGAMYAVAKDVKLQIEFNPAVVGSYRLIGYENRRLNDEDFVNDKVDAGEMGANHTVTALYEIIPVGINSPMAAPIPTLKYNTTSASKQSAAELATIKTRYKTPEGSKSIEASVVIKSESLPIRKATENSRFATAVAWFGLYLRKSELITLRQKEALLNLARTALGYDPYGYKAEFIRLVEAGW